MKQKYVKPVMESKRLPVPLWRAKHRWMMVAAQFQQRFEELRPVMHAVEWCNSGD